MTVAEFENKFVNKIICGDCLEVMKDWPNNCVDLVLTDPPYGLGFMGKDWDTFKDAVHTKEEGHYITRAADGRPIRHQKGFSAASAAGLYDHSRNAEFQRWFTLWAKQVLRIAKPGAMMLIFGGTRTFHRVTCAIEDAGWIIRDCMMWLYGSGFPKSLNISKAMFGKDGTNNLAQLWNGWGTALKPGWEPIIVAMKPLDGTFAENAEKWGVAGLNIDGGRIALKTIGEDSRLGGKGDWASDKMAKNVYGGGYAGKRVSSSPQGRWPANVILDEQAATMLDEQSGYEKDRPAYKALSGEGCGDGHKGMFVGSITRTGYKTSGGASRFFYCAKASRAERNTGLEAMEKRQNHHPTVKPLKLMEYLCTLTKTPTGGLVLDPFGGSGTTAMACVNTGREYTLIEKEEDYCEIATRRVAWAEKQKAGQMGLFTKGGEQSGTEL